MEYTAIEYHLWNRSLHYWRFGEVTACRTPHQFDDLLNKKIILKVELEGVE